MDFIQRCVHNGSLFDEAFFDKCPNCKQSFQGDVVYEMTKSQLSFVEREFKEVPRWRLKALNEMIIAIYRRGKAARIEGEEVCDKLLALIGDNKNSESPSLALDNMDLAGAYHSIARFFQGAGTEQSLEKAKSYYEKTIHTLHATSRSDCEAQFLLRAMKKEVAKVEARLKGDSLPEQRGIDLGKFRLQYEVMLRRHGENGVETIGVGANFAENLYLTFHTIEALRLLEKLLVTSRRVHGSSHKMTKFVDGLSQRLKSRYVRFGRQQQIYQVLRYENDGNSCVIRGPITKSNIIHGEPRNDDNWTTFSVPITDIVFAVSLPVMLHGLKKAQHLNGEIGDIRDYCKLSNRHVVHLEGNTSKPVKVKQENLRILFDLPDPKKESGSP